MRRLGAVLALLVLVGAAPAAEARHKKKRRGHDESASSESSGPKELHVRAAALSERRVTVELVGFSKAPGSNLFTFTDERGRHFVPQGATCEAGEGKALVCQLEIPVGYEHRVVKDVLVHVGSLKGRTVHAASAEVESAFAEKREATDAE